MLTCPCCGETPRTPSGWVRARARRIPHSRIQVLYILESRKAPIKCFNLELALDKSTDQIIDAISRLRADLVDSPWEIYTSKDGYILRARA